MAIIRLLRSGEWPKSTLFDRRDRMVQSGTLANDHLSVAMELVSWNTSGTARRASSFSRWAWESRRGAP